MRRFVLLMGSLLIGMHIALGGVLVAGRLDTVPACLQYMIFGESPTYGVIDVNTGARLVNHGQTSSMYVGTNERYYIAATPRGEQIDPIRAQRYQVYDLALVPDPTNHPSLTIPLQTGITFPSQGEQFSAVAIYQYFPADVSTIAGHLAFRWTDLEQHSFLTIASSDGTNLRTLTLDPALRRSQPVGWSPDARYLLLRAEQTNRYKLHTILDTQTMQYVALPPELLLPDAANWQPAEWSPMHAQIAAIRPADADAFQKPLRVSATQLVLYSPADGTTHLLDLPTNFFAQSIVWSPDGAVGMIVGTYVASNDGRATQRDYRGYMLFTAAGVLNSGILRGISQPQESSNRRFGVWAADGHTWLYLSQSDPTILGNPNYFELLSYDSRSGDNRLLESRLATQWWTEVFDEDRGGDQSTRQDVVLVTVAEDERLNVDLLDTQTMQRSRLVTDADRLLPLMASPPMTRSTFRLFLRNRDQSVVRLFHALVSEHGTLRYVWSALDGTNHHEQAFDANNVIIVSTLLLPTPTFFYHLRNGDRSTIGKIDLLTGERIELLKELTFLDTGYVFPNTRGDYVAFAVTNILTGPSDLYVSALDGSSNKFLAAQTLSSPIWSPDGSQLAYMAVKNGKFTIFIVDQDGDTVRELPTNIKLAQSYQAVYLRDWTPCPTRN